MKSKSLLMLVTCIAFAGCQSAQITLHSEKDWPDSFKQAIAFTEDEVLLLDKKSFKSFTTDHLKPTMRPSAWSAFEKRFAGDKTRHMAYIIYTDKPMPRGFNYWQFGPVATNKQTGRIRDLYLTVRRWNTTIDGKEAHIHMLRLNQNYEAKPGEELSLLVRNSGRGLDKTFKL